MWDSARGGSQPLALRLSVANGRDQILRVTRSRIYLRQRIEVKNRIRNTKLKKKKRKGEGEGEGKEIEMQNKEAGPMWGKEEVLRTGTPGEAGWAAIGRYLYLLAYIA